MSNYLRYLLLLVFILLIKAGIMVWVIQEGDIRLGPDEAQYWTWSQLLDWGYYSKPPGIAWQIWLGTKFFGNTELGVRVGSVVLGMATSITLFFLAKTCRLKPQAAFWTGMAFTFSPLGMMGSLFAITDIGMFFFWTVGCLIVCENLAKDHPLQDIFLGMAILAGSLFKWPIYLLWVFVLIFFRTWSILRGVAISLLGLLPSLIWNSQHNWVTFRHVFATVHATESSQAYGNFWDFLGSQAALFSPILFILLLLSLYFFWKEFKTVSQEMLFCATACFVPLMLFLFISIFKKMQGNWCQFAYPTAFVWLCYWYVERKEPLRKWVYMGVGLSALLCAFLIALPTIQSRLSLPFTIPYSINPFKHNVGWDHLNGELRKAGYRSEENFTFGDKYQTTSLLSFYAPDQKRAYFLNLHGIRKNQFSFWPGMSTEQKGRTGFFVLTENSPHLKKLERQISYYKNALSPYFKEVHLIGIKPIYWNDGKPTKEALIFKCIDYNGKEIKDPDIY